MINNKLYLSVLLCLITNNTHAMNQVHIAESDLALINAAKDHNIQKINKQLQRGANINPKGAATTALIEVCKLQGYNQLITVLLENEADVNLPDAQLRTPLHFAAQLDNVTTLDQLQQAGANLNAQDTEGNTALHLASQKGHINTLKWLARNGADVNIRNKKGLAPLHEATLGASICSYATLPHYGADLALVSMTSELPHAPLPAGSTAFHASTQVPVLNRCMQKVFLTHLLFPDELTLKACLSLLCSLRRYFPAAYNHREKLLLPHLAMHFSVQTLANVIKSKKKNIARLGRIELQRRAAKVQAILRMQDANAQTALARETQQNPNNVQSKNTLLDATHYTLHFKPFVAALRTNTLAVLPDNVFKSAYEYALPRKEEPKAIVVQQSTPSSGSCVIC